MSRQRKLIAKRAKELGIQVRSLDWEPVSKGSEKAGPDGGWTMWDTDNNVYLGLNVSELIIDMECDMMLTRDGPMSAHDEAMLKQAFPGCDWGIEPGGCR